jgi:hypothetical protein
MDKLISIKGLVIRTTPVIPDMKEGKEALEFNPDPAQLTLYCSFLFVSTMQLQCAS